VRGLLGDDNGRTNDFQLPDGTVLPQPMNADQILAVFAAAWHTSPETSLLDLPPGAARDVGATLQHPISIGPGDGSHHG
jgi:hypothetical protein